LKNCKFGSLPCVGVSCVLTNRMLTRFLIASSVHIAVETSPKCTVGRLPRRERSIKSVVHVWGKVDEILGFLHNIAQGIREAPNSQIDYHAKELLPGKDISHDKLAARLASNIFPDAREGIWEALGARILVQRGMLLETSRDQRKLAIGCKADLAPGGVKKLCSKTKNIWPESEPPFPTMEGQGFYPQLPQVEKGQSLVPCPYCLQPVDYKDLTARRGEGWTRHVEEHLKPYFCLFPECAGSSAFWGRREDWKAHMATHKSYKEDVPGSWTQEIHATLWYCCSGHAMSTFNSALDWRAHVRREFAHVATEDRIRSMEEESRRLEPREPFVCPLCEKRPPSIPNKVKDVNKAHEVLLDHILDHLQAISWRFIPSPALCRMRREESGPFSRERI
jgi:hypothetical protein